MNPVIHALDLHNLTPVGLFLSLPASARHVSFLAGDGSPDSRWSVLAWDPVEVSRGKDFRESSPAHEAIRMKNDHHLPFLGGLIGAIDYEGSFEFSRYDRALVYDHQESRWWGMGISEETLKNIFSRGILPPCSLMSDSLRVAPEHQPFREEIFQDFFLKPLWDPDEYQHAFQFLHENIRRGEIYQACLTFPFVGPPVDNTRQAFFQQMKKYPAPMAAYLEQTHRTILSFSPERFVQWDGKILQTKPIKGTRPRGKTVEEDERLKAELLQDEKERAELCMITDLLRNDMAQVSKPGSVKVLEQQALQALPNLWHTFSHVRSETREGVDAWNILEAMSPGGSISGCPKKRAMELLAEVEGIPRGVYTGCIGYLGDHGTMDFSIAIRTLEQTSAELRGGFGSGIVYDSDVHREYEECLAKAKPFLAL